MRELTRVKDSIDLFRLARLPGQPERDGPVCRAISSANMHRLLDQMVELEWIGAAARAGDGDLGQSPG